MAENQPTATSPEPANEIQLSDDGAPPPVFPPIILEPAPLLHGAPVLPTHTEDDSFTHIEKLRALHMRPDDVIIAAYPKSGSHWTWEVVQMLKHNRVEYERRTKEALMLALNSTTVLNSEPSPRVFNTHLWTVHLPLEIVEKNIKIIHVVRNPKDVVVSLYHQLRQEGVFTFGQFLNLYMKGLNGSITPQFQYLRQWEEYQKAHPHVPVKTLYYEQMKKDPVQVTKDLAQFLNNDCPVSETFCAEVANACSFQNMKTIETGQIVKELPKIFDNALEEASKVKLYRKGVVGDWKNLFTVAQNEVFERFIERESKGLSYNFIYE